MSVVANLRNSSALLGQLIPELGGVETLVFAGGGNRCWWQAGLVAAFLEKGWQLPPTLVGTSAGAAIAAACMMGGPERALRNCLSIYANNHRLFDWRGLARRQLVFAHQDIYPRWIESFLDDESYCVLRGGRTRLTVALTRPARYLGLSGSVLAGTLAYFIDKYLWKSIHPHLPTYLGLRQDFVVLNDCSSTLQARNLLRAAAAAPPFMSALPLGTGMAFDGGLALLRKSNFSRNSPDSRRTHATATVIGQPSCVKRFSSATRICSSTT